MPHHVSEVYYHVIEAELSQMLSDGIIERFTTPWSSPIMAVPKPNGSQRLCNNFRKFNAVSNFNSYPLPRVDNLVDQLVRACFVFTLNLTKGHWQVATCPGKNCLHHCVRPLAVLCPLVQSPWGASNIPELHGHCAVPPPRIHHGLPG